MLTTVLICGVCMAAEPLPVASPEPQSQARALGDYQRARAKVGRDADAHVRLALWCESHGLPVERLKHLALAVLTDPAHAPAHGLLGQVAFRGRWQPPDEIRDRLQADEPIKAARAEYQIRRARIGNSADGHWKIAMWCEEHDLKPEATAHLRVVTMLDPRREAAWKRLGYKKQGSRWVTEEQLAKEKADAEARTKADKYWTTVLTRLRTRLEDTSNHAEAIRALQDVTEPDAVPSIWAIFARSTTTHQKLAVQLFGQIDSPGSARALSLLAVVSESGEVRGRSIETLRRRDPYDVASFLVGLLRDPVLYPIHYHYAVQPTGWDAVGSVGFVFVQGPLYDFFRTYTVDEALSGPQPFVLPMNGYVSRVMAQRRDQLDDLNRIVGQILTEFASVVEAAEVRGREVDKINARIMSVLSAVNGSIAGHDREAWKKWWIEEQGYAYDSPPPPTRQDLTLSDDKPTYIDHRHLSCFAAGTPVHTLGGIRPIESVQIGDQVLTQNPRTAELSYQPVLAAIQNKPDGLVEINLGKEIIRATGIHRFWKAGLGWVMARDLKPGDTLRALGGIAEVKSIKRGLVEPVFNLKVMQAQSFFVGERGMLVHDNSPVEPVSQPFDLVPGLAGD